MDVYFVSATTVRRKQSTIVVGTLLIAVPIVSKRIGSGSTKELAVENDNMGPFLNLFVHAICFFIHHKAMRGF